MKRKPKFPKEYYEIARVEGVSEEVIKEYRSLIRHEMYVEQKEKQLQAFTYGETSDVEYLMPPQEPDFNSSGIQNEALAEALDSLQAENEGWYNAVMGYYFQNGKISYSKLAKKLGISKPEAYRRLVCGLHYIIKKMDENGQNT